MADKAPYTGILYLSFGGPDGPADVRPFLENVTRGRGVPPERLDNVAQHYLHFGGVSPINHLNMTILSALSAELRRNGLDLEVYYGNRNWHPTIEFAMTELAKAGHRRVLVFPTSAWGGYSGCRQYNEDIRRALSSITGTQPGSKLPSSACEMELRKLPHYWDHPLFTDCFVDAVRASYSAIGRDDARLVFTAHSIPHSADATDGPASEGGHLYSRQVHTAAARVADRLGIDDYDVVWQSRSGPPQVPWLKPDICDHLETLAARGVGAVVVSPIGFVTDHLEVVWDLDHEARERAAELSIAYERSATPGLDPRFIDMIVSLIRDQMTGDGLVAPALMGCTDNGRLCAEDCCVRP